MLPKVLVTAALTYANGPAHLGHILEAIQTDVYVRARRMLGHDVIFMWADDSHGTPIQVRARKEMDAFKKALDEGTYKATVDAELELGGEVFVEGTPTMFVNGVRVANATDVQSISTAIDKALAG